MQKNLTITNLELENWGIEVNALKEPAISKTFVGWTKDWEKDKWKTDGDANQVLFSNKYEDLNFVLPDTGHMYYIREVDFVFQRHYEWTIHAQCDLPSVEEDEVTIILAVTLIQKIPQTDGVKAMHPVEGSDHDKKWDPDEEND